MTKSLLIKNVQKWKIPKQKNKTKKPQNHESFCISKSCYPSKQEILQQKARLANTYIIWLIFVDHPGSRVFAGKTSQARKVQNNNLLLTTNKISTLNGFHFTPTWKILKKKKNLYKIIFTNPVQAEAQRWVWIEIIFWRSWCKVLKFKGG